ncbi:MAG: polyamine aminopropyltransferase [Spirochaetes bacterium]|nr:polyamine aminopropyltransferase [Spirochaetota bacterium]MBU0957107.1 polyamine aminopropyltransferase [Spirochaetota bacterium]
MNPAKGREIRERLNPHIGFFYAVDHILERRQTPFQLAELVETPAFGRVLLLDGITQVSEQWEYRYHEPMVHPALLAHPDPKQVLIIGGGDGGILREVLLHTTVTHVDLVELDEAVVEFAHAQLQHVHQGGFDDPRVQLHYHDGRTFVENSRQHYDAIIMDMTDPSGPSCRLYTKEFFQAVAAKLHPGAVFVMHGESPIMRPAAWACIDRTLSAVFPRLCTATCFVPMYATLWSFRYAGSGRLPVDLSPLEVESFLLRRLLRPPQLTTPAMWPALFAPDPVLAAAAVHPDGRLILDSAPDFPDSFDPRG